jgi:hypothetical protein
MVTKTTYPTHSLTALVRESSICTLTELQEEALLRQPKDTKQAVVTLRYT